MILIQAGDEAKSMLVGVLECSAVLKSIKFSWSLRNQTDKKSNKHHLHGVECLTNLKTEDFNTRTIREELASEKSLTNFHINSFFLDICAE